MTYIKKHILCATLLCLALPAMSEPLQEPVMTLSHSRNQTVANDELDIIASLEKQGANLGELQSNSSKIVNTVVSYLKQKGFSVEILNVSVNPNYDQKGRLDKTWTYTSSIKFNSTNFTKINEVLPYVSDKLRISSTSFTVSDKAREATLKDLKRTVLKEFMVEAQDSAKSLGFNSAVLKDITVSAIMPTPAPYPMMMAMAAKSADSGMGLSQDGAGTTNLSYSVSGSVYLKK